jgi:hypothetical protein
MGDWEHVEQQANTKARMYGSIMIKREGDNGEGEQS